MLNYVWVFLIVVAVIMAAITGTPDQVTTGAIDSAKKAVEIAIGLIGIMSLWLGIMRIAERAGLVAMLARVIAPIMKRLFPEIPPDHPAMGAMIMNLSANMLGLNNAATPLGLNAMRELQELNEDKDSASNSMIMFLAINTASVQLIPATVIGLLAAAGSRRPTTIIASTLVASAIGTVFAVIFAKIGERIQRVREGVVR